MEGLECHLCTGLTDGLGPDGADVRSRLNLGLVVAIPAVEEEDVQLTCCDTKEVVHSADRDICTQCVRFEISRVSS